MMIIKLIFSLGICLLAGVLGSIFTMPAIPTWYAALQKSLLNPPNWVFGPVWTTLYIMMGIALFLIINQKNQNKEQSQAIGVFYLQLILNILWSIVFFGYHRLLIAFLVILLLWLAILINIIRFYNLNKPAGLLLVPYLVWVSFASYLNFAIYWLNGGGN